MDKAAALDIQHTGVVPVSIYGARCLAEYEALGKIQVQKSQIYSEAKVIIWR